MHQWRPVAYRIVVATLLILVVSGVVISYGFWAGWWDKQHNSQELDITIIGTIACLPHQDSSGPQTLECALGLKTANNVYYGLSDVSDPTKLITGKQVTINGKLQLTKNDKYLTAGTIKVVTLK